MMKKAKKIGATLLVCLGIFATTLNVIEKDFIGVVMSFLLICYFWQQRKESEVA